VRRGAVAGAPHFTWAELTRSATAAAWGLANDPGPAEASRLAALARGVLEPLRRRFGPLAVTSGYRSAELNWYVSLSRTSRHCTGEAADLKPLAPGVSLAAVALAAAAELPVGQVIVEHPPGGWVHLALARPQERPRLFLQRPGSPLMAVTPEELKGRTCNPAS
jgi:hypothetical protein